MCLGEPRLPSCFKNIAGTSCSTYESLSLHETRAEVTYEGMKVLAPSRWVDISR